MELYLTKLAKFLRRGVFALILFLFFGRGAGAQNCIDIDGFNIENSSVLNWNATPEFSLPFQMVYGVPVTQRNPQLPLRHGFLQITDHSFLYEVGKVNQAQIYYGSAYPNASQPWELDRIPWGNDMELYSAKWKNDHLLYSEVSGSRGIIDPALFSFDIERVWRFDHEILQQKKNEAVPLVYRNLSDENFLKTYKKDMRELYARSVKDFLANGKAPYTKITSYTDTPIVNTFQNIQGRTWEQWRTDKSVLNFICTDENGNVGGPFYDQLDIITPTAYYYYDYPHLFAGEYLSYLLFQIEANKAWTSKPVIPFVWMRYSYNPEVVNKFIRPWMAEATAIFPFFSGAEGLWLWENPMLFQNETNFQTYAWFQKGLYRLSLVKDFFEGDHELVIQTSARDYNENRQPIWRGVFKNGQLLVAAHNPFASSENQEVEIPLVYKNWSGTIKLKGYETRLCVFDLTALGVAHNEIAELTVFPNPVSDNFKLRFQSDFQEQVEVRLVDLKGVTVQKEVFHVVKGWNETVVSLDTVSESNVILQLIHSKGIITKKIIKVE
jgi:hypothetical protein